MTAATDRGELAALRVVVGGDIIPRVRRRLCRSIPRLSTYRQIGRSEHPFVLCLRQISPPLCICLRQISLPLCLCLRLNTCHSTP